MQGMRSTWKCVFFGYTYRDQSPYKRCLFCNFMHGWLEMYGKINVGGVRNRDMFLSHKAKHALLRIAVLFKNTPNYLFKITFLLLIIIILTIPSNKNNKTVTIMWVYIVEAQQYFATQHQNKKISDKKYRQFNY